MQTSSSRWLAAGQVAAGLLAVLAVPQAAPLGRFLLACAGVLLVVLGTRDLLLRPALRADSAGLEVVDGWRRRALPWSEVEQLRVVTDRRTPLLELDLGDTVIVLSRRRLGAPPAVVLAELALLRP